MYTLIGSYQPLKKIATGGMAEVYLARSLNEPAKLYAIKVLLTTFPPGSEGYRNFEEEASILLEIEDERIVKTYAFGTDYHRPYFVMEYIHGVSGAELMLEARNAKRNVPLGLSLGITRNVALALDTSYHTVTDEGTLRRVVHNDVSPHNFQIGFDGSIKLLDYGVAIQGEENDSSGRRGKFAYMSPEAIRKEPLDHRSDLFSLGVSMYEMIVHRRAFKAQSPKETMERVLKHDLVAPSSLSDQFPEALENIILKALAPKPEDRFQCGRELAEAIEEYAQANNLPLDPQNQATRVQNTISDVITARDDELNRLISVKAPGSLAENAKPTVSMQPTADEPEIIYLELPPLLVRMALATTIGFIVALLGILTGI